MIVVFAEQHASAAVPAVRATRELVALTRREQLRIRIVQLLHEPACRAREQLAVVERVDVLARHEREDLLEEVRVGAHRRFLQQKAAGDDRDEEQCGNERRAVAGTGHDGARGRTE